MPEELPDLPESGEDTESADASDDLLDTELAPDELPPMDDIGEAGVDGVISETKVAPEISDRRSYFSNLLQKINEEGLKSTKLINPSLNVLSDMKKHWKDRKKNEALEVMNAELVQNIQPLQQLEQEWSQLQDDIEQKKALLKQKEQEIQEMAENLKQLAKKVDNSASK